MWAAPSRVLGSWLNKKKRWEKSGACQCSFFPPLLLASLSCEESQPPAPSSVNSAMLSHHDGHDHLKPEAKLKLSSQMLSFAT